MSKNTNSKKDLKFKNVLVIGGTQGIGRAVSIEFASLGANVIIAGRNETFGKQVTDEMIKNNPDNIENYMFKKVDQSIINDIKKFVNEINSIYESTGGLHYLVLSAGGPPSLPVTRKETIEEIEYQFAFNALGRFVFIYLLVPMLIKANGAKVLIIFGGGQGTKIDLQDIEFKNKPYKFMSVARRDLTYLDTMTKEFSNRYYLQNNISFYHLYPKVVHTNNLVNNGWSKFLANIIFSFLSVEPKEYAKVVISIATLEVFNKKSGIFLNEKANEIKGSSWVSDPVNREILWNYSLERAKLI